MTFFSPVSTRFTRYIGRRISRTIVSNRTSITRNVIYGVHLFRFTDTIKSRGTNIIWLREACSDTSFTTRTGETGRRVGATFEGVVCTFWTSICCCFDWTFRAVISFLTFSTKYTTILKDIHKCTTLLVCYFIIIFPSKTTDALRKWEGVRIVKVGENSVRFLESDSVLEFLLENII